MRKILKSVLAVAMSLSLLAVGNINTYAKVIDESEAFMVVDTERYAGDSIVYIRFGLNESQGIVGMESYDVCDFSINGVCYDPWDIEHPIIASADQGYSCRATATNICCNGMVRIVATCYAASDTGEFEEAFDAHM